MGSPRGEGKDGGTRDLKETGRMEHSLWIPFSQDSVWKDLSLCWARVLIKLIMTPTSGPPHCLLI